MTSVISLVEMVSAAVRRDGWENVILGFGGPKDPSAYTTFSSRAPLNDALLEALYVEDHFAGRIVEAVVKESLRPGWEFTTPGDPAETAKVRDAVAAREAELCVAQELSQGACWGRLFGGAVTWIGADDNRDPAAPIDEKNIRSIRFLHTFDRRDVQPHAYYQDPNHPKFGRPESYKILPQIAVPVLAAFGVNSGAGAVVHETRLIVWRGQPTTNTRRMQLNTWDDSVLERCWDALRQVGEDLGAKSLLLGRISQAIYKIADLYSMISGKQEAVLTRRLAMLDQSRSRARAIAIDKDKEDFVVTTQPVAGVPELIDRGLLRLASAADMPLSVLLKQSPEANGGGDAELDQWYASVDVWRTLELRPAHERLTRLQLLAKDGPTGGEEPDRWEILYRALRTPKPKELAETRKIEADTYSVYIEKGLTTAEELAVQVFSPSSGKTDFAFDEEALKAKLERRRALDNQPPKDNAELGTVGARATSAMEIVTQVATKQIPRESGKALLVELFRFTPEVAEQILGPAGFVPAPPPGDPTPGPAPGPQVGGGAGAPQGLPGVSDGGDPKKEPTPL